MQSYFGEDTVNLYSTSLRKVALLAGAGAVAAAGLTGMSAAQPAQASEQGVWDKVAECESGGDWHINTGNGYYGGLQFSAQTWNAFGGSGTADEHSKAEQIDIAQKVLKEQGPGAWPVCGEKAGLTKSNGAADEGGGSGDDGKKDDGGSKDDGDSGKVGLAGNVTVSG
ncbi:Transglycosylase-like domain-containing protein [Brevibacterium siliguriense]|uniref:Transglycosylase-like domain-containing protein n=1 Tax=Brevibacterium siliguriense TaxID=1136497 RepID=A0A1H1UCV1_9MICO|nr:Transglycosylase-like domain-containing protein [Brevibacterium siliguriense]